jgi:hypothetical protein
MKVDEMLLHVHPQEILLPASLFGCVAKTMMKARMM